MTANSVAAAVQASHGDSLAPPRQNGDWLRELVVRELNAAIAVYRGTHNLNQKEVAATCGVEEQHLSKLLRGEGDLFAFGGRLPKELRQDWLHRLALHLERDPQELAAEQLIQSAVRFLVLSARPRMAKAGLK